MGRRSLRRHMARKQPTVCGMGRSGGSGTGGSVTQTAESQETLIGTMEAQQQSTVIAIQIQFLFSRELIFILFLTTFKLIDLDVNMF